MLMVAVICAGILDPRAGCIVERTPVRISTTPQQCVSRAQETFAEQVALHPAHRVAFWGCQRRR